jgi:hypothetical protein
MPGKIRLSASRMTINDVLRFIPCSLYDDSDLRRILLAGL